MKHEFKTDSRIFWLNELKIWGLSIVVVLIVTFFFSFFLNKSGVNEGGLIGVFLIVLGGFFTRFQVKTIEIDDVNQTITFRLWSRMSGEKVKQYQLQEIQMKLVNQNAFNAFFSSRSVLTFYVGPKSEFRIDGRYGFTQETLEKIFQQLSPADVMVRA